MVCSVTGAVPKAEINTQSKFLQNRILFYELITVSIFHAGDLQSLACISKMLEALHKKFQKRYPSLLKKKLTSHGGSLRPEMFIEYRIILEYVQL